MKKVLIWKEIHFGKMVTFVQSKLYKLEFVSLFLTIFSPLVLTFVEPFTFFLSDKVFELYTSLRSYIWIASFILFCLFSSINSLLTIIKLPQGNLKQATSAKLILIVILLLIFGFAFKFKSTQTDWVTVSIGLIYLSLFFYLTSAYLGSFLLWLKSKPHQALTAFSAIIIFSWLIFTINFIILYEKVRDLGWENYEIKSKIDVTAETANDLWEEHDFEKEIKRNLSYYLPEGFSQKINFMDLIPIDSDLQKVKVRFIHGAKTYSAIFSYSKTPNGMKIERISAVILEP